MTKINMKITKGIVKTSFFTIFLSLPLSAQFANLSHDNSSEYRRNSFGVNAEFFNEIQRRNALNKNNVDKRWEHYREKFDAGYDVIPLLKSMMNEAQIPQEFLFLAMAESEFNLRAYSPKKASGIWQIVPKTAKEWGLKITDFVDERRDPIKSTKMAIKYLQYLKNATGEWYLAAMAYNCGIGRLKKGIKRAGTEDIAVLKIGRAHV